MYYVENDLCSKFKMLFYFSLFMDQKYFMKFNLANKL